LVECSSFLQLECYHMGQFEAEYTSDTTNLARTVEDEVAVATSALNLEKESYFDEGIYSESEDSGEEDAMPF